MDVWEPRVSVFGKWTLTLHTLTLEELLSYFHTLSWNIDLVNLRHIWPVVNISVFYYVIFRYLLSQYFVIEIKNFHTDKHTFMYY